MRTVNTSPAVDAHSEYIACLRYMHGYIPWKQINAVRVGFWDNLTYVFHSAPPNSHRYRDARKEQDGVDTQGLCTFLSNEQADTPQGS